MKYPVLSRESVLRLVALPRKERMSEAKAAIEMRGEGDEFVDAPVVELTARLNKLMKKLGDSPKKGTKQTIQLESDAAVAVHDTLKQYAPAILMDLDFWAYLALSPLERFVAWRYAVGPGPIPASGMANFGAVKRSENLLFRLWSRAELVYDVKHADPYTVARRGSVDFWRSHVLRQNFCNARTFARGFVLFQYPDGKKSESLGIQEIRELAKRVRRLRSNVVFEILDDEQVGKMLARESAEIVAV